MVTKNGTVAGGGAVETVSHMAHDIASGESVRKPIEPGSGELTSADPLATNEQWIRIGVLLLALAIAIAGVVTPIALALVAVDK